MRVLEGSRESNGAISVDALNNSSLKLSIVAERRGKSYGISSSPSSAIINVDLTSADKGSLSECGDDAARRRTIEIEDSCDNEQFIAC